MKTSKDPKAVSAPEAPSHGDTGALAWKKLVDRIRALPAAEVKPINADVGEAALLAIGVAARVNEAPLYPRFEAISGAEFKLANVRDLTDVAWAAKHAAIVADRLRAAGSEAKIPATLLKQATEIEGRMQRCCEYYFSDDPVLGVEVARLSPGTGHRDLAEDLLGYAAIYEQRMAVIEHDRKHFRAGDLADARTAAKQIFDILAASLSSEARVAADDHARAWTLLSQVYGEVRAAGLFIERADAASPHRYPSLHTAGRDPGGRPKKTETPPPATPPATP